MKILIATPYFYPSIGGVQNYVLNLAKGLRDQGKHDVFIVTSNHISKKYVEEKIEGLRVIRLPRLFKLSNTPINPFWYFKLKKIIKEEKPDVINAHSPVPFMADMAASASKKIPFVLTYHAASLKKENALLMNIITKIYSFFELLTFNKANKVIAVSRYVKYCLPKKIQSKTHIIYNAIDVTKTPTVKVTRMPRRLIFVGSLDSSHEWKGLSHVLIALQNVINSGEDIELIVLGDGNKRKQYVEQAEKLNIKDNVIFFGNVNGIKKMKLIQSASAMVVYPTTENDAFPTVFLEAWACRTPIISADIGALSGIIRNKDNGLLVESHNPERLGHVIKYLLQDKKLQKKLTSNGYEDVLKHYTWDKVVKETNDLFISLVGKSIIHVAAYYSPHLGGMEKVAEILATAQARAGYNVEVVTSNIGFQKAINVSSNEEQPHVNRLAAIEIAHTPIIPKLFFKLLGVDRKSIVQLHIAQAYTPEIVYLASKVRRFRYVAHIHLDVAPSGPAGFLLKIYKPLILKRVLKAAALVVVFTEEQKSSIHKKFGIELKKIRVIPNGVEDKFYYNKQRVMHKKPRLLFVGRLSTQKNLPQLIHALDGISDQFTTTIVGDGELRLELNNLTNNLKLKNVNFVGRADGDKLLNYYKQSDIFVLPSEREGMPLVLLEAMAMGLPIIATNVIGTRDIVINGVSGLLVPFGDINALRIAINSLSSYEKYTEMSTNSRKLADRYCWENIITKFERLYKTF